MSADRPGEVWLRVSLPVLLRPRRGAMLGDPFIARHPGLNMAKRAWYKVVSQALVTERVHEMGVQLKRELAF